MHTISANFLEKVGITAQTVTGNGDGTGVLVQGYQRAQLVLLIGTLGGTTPTISFQVKESNDNGGSDAYAFTNLAAAVYAPTAAGIYLIDMNLDAPNRKAYQRVSWTTTGTNPSIPIAAVWLLERGRALPPTQDNTVVSV